MSLKIKANRVDPYQNFMFRVKWDNKYVAGVNKVSMLTRTTEVVRFREGGDPLTEHLLPGQTQYGSIRIERGVTHDTAFEQWANKVWDFANSNAGENADKVVSLADFRKDLVIELYNEARQKVLAYNVYRAWVSEYHALPELNAMGSGVAIQSVVIQNEGWMRDPAVKEPSPTQFDDPKQG